MTEISVLFFANLAEEVGRRQARIQLEEPTLSGLRAALAAELSADAIDALNAENVRIARNHEMWDGSTPLAHGDEVAFLPPVTGG